MSVINLDSRLTNERHESHNMEPQQVLFINSVNMRCFLEPGSQQEVKWAFALTYHGADPSILGNHNELTYD